MDETRLSHKETPCIHVASPNNPTTQDQGPDSYKCKHVKHFMYGVAFKHSLKYVVEDLAVIVGQKNVCQQIQSKLQATFKALRPTCPVDVCKR